MGSGQSTLSGPLTRAELLKQTGPSRNLINFLFNYFANQIGQKDLLALANPGKCRDYIFVMADALSSIFIDLRVEAGKDKDGVIYFRKTTDLAQPAPGSSEDQQKRILCISVAFFYIRIFQIYAALALSVNDDVPYNTGIQPQRIGQRPMHAPGLDPFYIYNGGATQTGGATSDNLRQFNILQNYVSRDPTRPPGNYSIDRYPNINLHTTMRKDNLTVSRNSTMTSGPFTVSCKFTIKPSPTDINKFLITFENFTSTEAIYINALKANGPIGYIVTQSGTQYYRSDTTGENIDDLIARVMLSSREVATGARPANKARVRVRGQAVPGYGATGYGPAPPGPPIAVLEGLKTYQYIASLKQVPKPLAHCVARSLQLLDIDPLSSSSLPQTVRTSICKVKFDDAFGGLPDINQAITTSPGIGSLHQLFFDKISAGKPDMTAESAASYQEFVRTMATQFAEGTAPATVNLASVSNRTDRMCASTGASKRDKVLTVRDDTSIRRAREAVQHLWKSQIEHDKKVVEILSKLIIITKVPGGKKVSLHPLILKYGNPGISIVAKQARELLVKYYSNCETAFRAAAGPLGLNGTPI
jgi:hypothetical protein